MTRMVLVWVGKISIKNILKLLTAGDFTILEDNYSQLYKCDILGCFSTNLNSL